MSWIKADLIESGSERLIGGVTRSLHGSTLTDLG